jgi:hypothetical protein
VTWRGGANVPSKGGGRWDARWPLASLRLDNSALILKLLTKTFVLTPADVAVVYPARSWLGRTGLGIQTIDARILVFWTANDSILPALEAAGFPTSPAHRRVDREIYIWSLGSGTGPSLREAWGYFREGLTYMWRNRKIPPGK